MRGRVLAIVCALVMGLTVVPAFAQRGGGGGNGGGGRAAAAPMQIMGTVQTFDGNDLIVKPANGPAVWITVPLDVKADKSQVKPGAMVTVEATMIDTGYVATQVNVN